MNMLLSANIPKKAIIKAVSFLDVVQRLSCEHILALHPNYEKLKHVWRGVSRSIWRQK
jgi:hypothetical protein